MSKKLDTQSIGLDVGLSFVKWLTGAENLHYGLWDGLDVRAENLGTAQSAYTDKLFELLPAEPCRILDIGGGAGETAKKLIALGHQVDIVIPAPFLADRCRANAPTATVHEMPFEDFETDARFDICLFSESFQYIPVDIALDKATAFLAEDGAIIVSDCFRTEAFMAPKTAVRPIVGGGHIITRFRRLLGERPLDVVFEEDITESVAPSIDLEQGLFNVFGHGMMRVDDELTAKKPKARWLVNKVLKAAIKSRARTRLYQRLTEQSRNSQVFMDHNQYLMVKLQVSK